MTTATRGTADDEEILTTELEPERPAARERLSPRTARIVFLSLAGIAALALVAAVLAVVFSSSMSAPAFRVWLWTALGVVVLVVLAEIVLLLLARPRKA